MNQLEYGCMSGRDEVSVAQEIWALYTVTHQTDHVCQFYTKLKKTRTTFLWLRGQGVFWNLDSLMLSEVLL